MKHISKSLIAALLLLFLAQTGVQSQTLSVPGDGKDFFVGYMLPSYNKVANSSTAGFYGASLLISTYTDNNVSIWYFDRTLGFEVMAARYRIPARTGIQVALDLNHVMMTDSVEIPEFCAVHVTADRPINVEFFSTGACSGGSFLPITTAGLGKRYVIASYQDNPGELGLLGGYLGPKEIEVSHGFFEIIAPFDGTQVTIIPNSTTLGGHAGYASGKGRTFPKESPYSVTLRRGQCYLVKSAGSDNDNDISGSIVESTKPIAVIAGHENAAIGGVSNRSLEGRDFMVEQMYPWDMWDTMGYVMIPLKDSQPSDPQTFEGTGENYRIFTWDTVGTQVNFYDQCIGAPIQMATGRLSLPAAERFQVTCPVNMESTNGKKFSAFQYDNRNFANAAPYPAPTMITVIPMSRWRTSFLWYVPANKFETLQAYYVNIIAPAADFDNGIKASFNGGTIKPLKQVLSLEQQFKIIPGHPGYTGVRFKLYPGSYYATGPNPFMVYNFGYRALDPNFDLGDFDGDDFFFSYGLPVGLKLGGTPHIRVTVDTLCSYWNVCVHDSTLGLANQGIKSVTLLDDPTGDFIKPGRQFKNTRLDDSLDPGYPGGNTNEINFTGDDSDVCFKVLVNKAIDSAYAPLFIADNLGGAILVELHYKPPIVRLDPDSGRYFKVLLTKDSCSSFVFYNEGNTKIVKDSVGRILKGKDGKDSVLHSGKSFLFTSDNLKLNNPSFKVTSTVPPLPASIDPGHSLIVTACFTARDSAVQKDTIILVNDCFTEPIDLIGKGAVPLIIADNHDFGAVIVDSTKCDTVRVRNVGDAPFTLTKNWVLHNLVNFNFSDTSLLPMVLNPKQSYLFTFCYTPHAEQTDTTVQNWGTTEQDPYRHSIKDTSILRGHGVKSGFVWDRTIQEEDVTCDESNTVRVYLLNNAIPGKDVPSIHVDTVLITGADAAEYHIVTNQFGYTPLGNFDLKPGDSIWVDIFFQADLSKPMPQKYADRHMDLIARNLKIQKDQIIEFTSKVFYAAPSIVPTNLNYGTVALGLPASRSFLLCDTGTAPLIVQSISPITYPVNNVSGIAPGTIIQPGGCILVQVDMGLTDYIDTTVVLNVQYKTTCTQIIPVSLQIAASFINPTNTGHPFDPTFLKCRSQADSIQARNLGTTSLTLKRMDIINQNPPSPPELPQFSFDNGTQVYPNINRVFKRGERRNYAVFYNPTVEGPVSATIQCTWDSLGKTSSGQDTVLKTIITTNLLTGTGRLERDTLEPLSASYTAQTGGYVDVPINLTRVLPADVDAHGITFNVTYRRDLLDYLKDRTTFDPSLSLVGPVPAGIPDGFGNETVTFVLQGNDPKVPITALAPIATMHFQLMVAKDYSSAISVSNAVFWGANPQDTLCYVINETKAAAFTPDPQCGDSTLRHYLYGNMPTKIIAVSPNPAIGSNTPIVTYEVKQSKVPLTIELYNALGEKIRTVENAVPHELGEYNLPLGMKNLPSGMYVIRITSPGYTESSSFVIQK